MLRKYAWRVGSLVLLLSTLVVLATPMVESARPTLYWGSRGTNVTRLQQRLVAWGYMKTAPTGYFGSTTAAAVRLFQRRNGLAPDGLVGPATWRALGLWTGSTAVATRSAGTGDVELLARLIAAEARGEPWNGLVGVGAVVRNRTRHANFPSSVQAVIYQRWQFESVSNGLIWQRNPTSTEYAAARTALAGTDPTGRAIYFWNPAKPVSSKWIWSRPIVARIGSHVFAR